MASSNSKNNPIVITDVNGLRRTIQIVSLIGTNGEIIELTNNAINVTQKGLISDVNSTSIPLLAGGKFTGTPVDVLNEGIIFINVFTDVASATDGLQIFQSSDGVNFDHCDEYTVPANSGKNYSINPYAKYLRVDYTNGISAQTEFRLQTIYKANSKPSSHRIQDPIIDDDDSELVKSILSAKFNGDGYGNIGATSSGNLRVTDAESGLSIAKGDVVGTTFVHKFGNAKDFDTSDLEVTIWDGAEDGTAWELMRYVYSTTADIDSISSSSLADNQEISIQGLDINGNLVVQNVTLNGQTRVALTTPLHRVFRAFNNNGIDLTGHVIIYVNTPITSGVPINNNNIRAIIDPLNQQTLMCVYTIPSGKKGYMRDWYIASSGGNKESSYVFKLVTRNAGKVFRTKHISALNQLAPIPYQHMYNEPEVFEPMTDVEIRVRSEANPAATENSISAGFDIVLVDI